MPTSHTIELGYIATVAVLMASAALRHTSLTDGAFGESSSFAGVPSVGDDQVCDDLEAFIVDNGGSIDGARCIYTEEGGGRGLVASTHLPYRQTYITVPNNVWMNEKNIKRTSDIRRILEEDDVVNKVCGKEWGVTGEPCRLIIALMHEAGKKEKSFWHPYIASMPELPTSPIWWSDSELEKLQSPSLQGQVLGLKKWLAEAHGELFPSLSDAYPEHFAASESTLERFTWSALHVWGRAFDTDAFDEANPERRTWGMIPFADLVNHQSYVESFYGMSKEGGNEAPFECWATECFQPGAEIFQSYGSHKSTAHFFLYYGFIPSGYVSSDVVSFEIAADDLKRMKKAGIKKPAHTFSVGYAGIDGHISEHFIKAFHAGNLITGGIPHTDSKEVAYNNTLGKILAAAQTAISGFPTSYEEDAASLAKGFAGYDAWATLTARTRFKLVLDKVVEQLQWRMSFAPENSTGWKNPQSEHLLVYDDDEIVTQSSSNKRDALFVVNVKL